MIPKYKYACMTGTVLETVPGDDGKVGRSHAGAHEQDDILVPGLPVVHHLLLEELQVILVVTINLQ